MSSKILEPWKTIAVVAYLLICLFDFWLMPMYRTYLNQEFISDAATQIKPENRAYMLEVIDRIAIDDWVPVTTKDVGGIIFHLTFGIMMTGTALTSRTWTISSSGISSKAKEEDDKR